jgi:hypothetical protein
MLDKQSWGDGPWQHEPDRVRYRDPDADVASRIERSTAYGHF